jgi:putative oxidoreductase
LAIDSVCKRVLLRRLFSTFARGLPGAALVLLRLVASATLIAHGIGQIHTGQPVAHAILDILMIGNGALLVAGLWTPIAGSLVVVLGLWDTLAQHGNLSSYVLLASIGAALALLGPGAWSFDAWLFGWKRIDIQS